MRYRWLSDEGVVRYVGRDNPALRGKRGRCLTFPKPGMIGNVLVEWDDGTSDIVPAGCLRMAKQPEPLKMEVNK